MKTWNLGFKDVYDFYFTLVRDIVARYRSRGRKWVNLEENKNSTILGSFERQYRQECQEKSPLRGLLGKNFLDHFLEGIQSEIYPKTWVIFDVGAPVFMHSVLN